MKAIFHRLFMLFGLIAYFSITAAAQKHLAGLDQILSAVQGSIRCTERQYEGTNLLIERTFRKEQLEDGKGSWLLRLEAENVTGRPDAFDVRAVFSRRSGTAKATAVAVHFDFGGWATDNYVMAPASVYNGNRYRVLGNGYNPAYTPDMLFDPHLPLTISNNPRLSMEPGGLSFIELQTGNLATPAVCFYSPREGKGFILLTEQQTRWGNSGLTMVENVRRDSCTISVIAPAVRGMAPDFGDFHPSGDKAPDWRVGDEVSIRMRVYVFNARQIPDLLEKFMIVRKDVTGPNHPRDQLPMSQSLEWGRTICSNNFIQAPVGSYYKPENNDHFQLGWVSGMMNSYPMLATGDEKERRRVMAELDFVTGALQGRSGYFYGGCFSNGVLRGDKEAGDSHLITAMVRKNGDALFWLMKHLLLFRDEGYGDSIRPAWEQAVRRLADAFTATWKKDGQFGQYVLPETGEVAVFNSTAGAVVPAGLVLAADYFHHDEWRKVAEESALYYYTRDVAGQGLTGGDCGDISQDPNSESAFGFLESLMALYHFSGEERWLNMAEVEAALCSTWTMSYDPAWPPESAIAKLQCHMAGAVWASIQNKHAAPGICTSSGDGLFKLYRATGRRMYADLIRDIQHAQSEAVNRPGHITTGNLTGSSMERIQLSDAEGRGSIGNFINTRNSWTETDGMLMAMELPGIYIRTDKKEVYAFDHIGARILESSGDYLSVEMHNGTAYDATVTVMAESERQASAPLSYTAFLKWPKVKVGAGKTVVVRIGANGEVTPVETAQVQHPARLATQSDFRTKWLSVHIDERGWITRMKNISVRHGRELSPVDKPSPLLCLYSSDQGKYYYPEHAVYDAPSRRMSLSYGNGSTASVLIEPVDGQYLRMTLLSLSPRKDIDRIQWGPVHTGITNILGEMLGVARDTSAAGNFAIGLMTLDEVTTGGPANTQGDVGAFEYLIHSPDPRRFPLPRGLKEGQCFSIGGDGINDVAFYSHPEEYYRILYGNAALVDSVGRISVVCHAADRSKSREIYFSLMPKMEANKSVHQQLLPLPGVDFAGSRVALWGCPDTIALMTVIQHIVLTEGLPYPTQDGKWIKDPARYVPGIVWGGQYDSAISYAVQLGFKTMEGWNLGEFYPDRSDAGDICLKMPFYSGKRSISSFTSLANKSGVSFGLHTLQNFLQHGISSDVSPEPNDSLCYLQKRTLVRSIAAADTIIEVDDPAFLNEVAGWEAHPAAANIIKIGKELIHYEGVSEAAPYVLRRVQRGYWGTRAVAHEGGNVLYKLQTNCYGGLSPDIFLQDRYADYYADLFKKNGMNFIDFDGEEGMFYQGHGEYSVKRFYAALFAATRQRGMDSVRITGATLSGGGWHYHSAWNVGGGKNMYVAATRSWGIEGKDLRNVTYGNYFPRSFGGNFGLTPQSTAREYENIQAISVGQGVTYMLSLSEKEVESCPEKNAIFRVIRTWEEARAANAFPSEVLRELSDAANYFHLEKVDADSWDLYKVNREGGDRKLFVRLKRAAGY